MTDDPYTSDTVYLKRIATLEAENAELRRVLKFLIAKADAAVDADNPFLGEQLFGLRSACTEARAVLVRTP